MKKTIALILVAVMLTALLAGCGDGALKSYKLRALDENGKPIEGVTLQVCTSENCRMYKTNSQGFINCEDLAEAAYEVHILAAPAGYTFDKEEVYTTSDKFEAHDFVLKTAK